MNTRSIALVSSYLLLLLLSSCASGPSSSSYSDIKSADHLTADQRFPRSLVYVKDAGVFRQYTQVLIDPVAVYTGTDSAWQGVDDRKRQEMVQFVGAEFRRVLQPGYATVDQPAAGVLRLRLTLVDMELTKPLLSAATHLVPVGLALNLGKGGTGAKGSFMGSVTLAGEISDAQTGELLAAFLTTQAPNAMDFTAMVTADAAARKAVTETAEKFKAALDRARGAPGA
jgi:hypothetical protein